MCKSVKDKRADSDPNAFPARRDRPKAQTGPKADTGKTLSKADRQPLNDARKAGQSGGSLHTPNSFAAQPKIMAARRET
jgi:hypothetical protein